jgi:hypothetical protein
MCVGTAKTDEGARFEGEMTDLKLSKQEQKMIQILRESSQAREEFRLTIASEDGRWDILVSTWPHGAKNKVHGQGLTFDEAWDNLSPFLR